jgi:single-strand selective monofunctional uracil DNA glycosylase
MSVKKCIALSKDFAKAVDLFRFSEPVTHVYNPLTYAWRPHQQYIEKFAKGKKKVLWLGMNPGPWGMAQTGIPFGQVGLVKDWMGIECKVDKPNVENPHRNIEGFQCKRNEVSGERLWGYVSQVFPKAADFFEDHYVLNYCPLVFMEESGRNRTPDKLLAAESAPLFEQCDQHLRDMVDNFKPELLMGVGGFATKRLKKVFASQYRVETLLHPSPASPIANRGWAQQARTQLLAMDIQWPD